jgi:hypothetical protein
MRVEKRIFTTLPMLLVTGWLLSACGYEQIESENTGGSTGTTDGSIDNGGETGGAENSGSLQAAVYLQNSDGMVVIEAENFDDASRGLSHAWSKTSAVSASSAQSVQVLPNLDQRIDSNLSRDSAMLEYRVLFEQGGTYHLWLRMYADDGNDNSVHAGANGVPQASAEAVSLDAVGSGNWEWTQDTMGGGVATITVESAGLHTINLWMREDGAQIDKILLAPASSFSPADEGPAESERDVYTGPDAGSGSDTGTETGTDTGGDTGGGDTGSDSGSETGGDTGSGSGGGDTGVAVDRMVSLSWNVSAGDIKGYYLYHGRLPDAYTDKLWVGNASSYQYNVRLSGDHFFAVTAVNQSDIESGFSAEASVSVAP